MTLDGLATVVDAVRAAGMVPLVVAPRGGTLPGGIAVQRSLDATRSVEFDAVLVGGSPVADPRVQLLLQECFRHAKAIGAWGAGAEVLAAAGISDDARGIVVADDPAGALPALQELMGAHRVWDRFEAGL